MFEMAVFFVFAAATVVLALVVVTHRNPVVSAIALVGSFFALSVIYVLLEAPFMAALQVIVYAGAIMVLFLFVIMLLNLQHKEEALTHPIQRVLAIAGTLTFAATLVWFIVRETAGLALPADRFMSDPHAIGIRLFEAYILPFEMVSILLLAAIVGALVLTQRAKNPEPKADQER